MITTSQCIIAVYLLFIKFKSQSKKCDYDLPPLAGRVTLFCKNWVDFKALILPENVPLKTDLRLAETIIQVSSVCCDTDIAAHLILNIQRHRHIRTQTLIRRGRFLYRMVYLLTCWQREEQEIVLGRSQVQINKRLTLRSHEANTLEKSLSSDSLN